MSEPLSTEMDEDELVSWAVTNAVRIALAGQDAELDALRTENTELKSREKRDEWREGIVNVIDHEGNYLGCMGVNTWAENARLTSEVSRLQRVADDAMARAEHFALHGDGPYRLCSDCQDAAIARGKRTKRAAALAPQEAHR